MFHGFYDAIEAVASQSFVSPKDSQNGHHRAQQSICNQIL